MEIRIEGFSHKLPLLVQRVFESVAAAGAPPGGPLEGSPLSFSEASFAREKEALVRKYRNVNMQV